MLHHLPLCKGDSGLQGLRVLAQVMPFMSTWLKQQEIRNVTLALKNDGNNNMLNNDIASG